MATTYDASARLTPANLVTLGRLALSPVVIVMILLGGPSYPALLLGFLIAITDAWDGYLARRDGATRSGAFLDPLADKVLVLGCAFALVAVDEWPLLPVAIIAVRELGISAYRSYWGRRGLAIPARRTAKLKTLVQEVAIGVALMPAVENNAPWVALVILWVAVALTVGTGLSYVWDGQRALSEGGKRR
jgi:CDP-diacylglycerol--glycerol-3-phosphate 3-phosphatidyltransferase